MPSSYEEIVTMPIQHAVLSLLDDGPTHGYELKRRFEAAIGPQWGRLNIGHLYQTLDRLARDGFVTSERVSNDVRPDRRVYALTEAGRDELAGWLEQPAERVSGYRDEMFFKLLVASRAGADTVVAVVSRQRAYQLGQLRTLGELRRDHSEQPLIQLLIDAARLHNEADLGLLDLAEEARHALAAAARVPSPAEAKTSDSAASRADRAV
jgi:DNA-binding PadR family transcriptional regulator